MAQMDTETDCDPRGEGIRDCCISAACMCAFWACNKHAGNVDLVSATTEITVHSIETVSGAWQTSAARLSLHADIALLQSFLLGVRTTVYVRYNVDCRHMGGEWWKTQDTHTHTRWQCLWLLTSQIPWFWPRAIKRCPFQGIPDRRFNMTAALINCLHGFDQPPSPVIRQATTYWNRSYQGTMLNRKDVPKKAPFWNIPRQLSYSAIVQGKMILRTDNRSSRVDLLSTLHSSLLQWRQLHHIMFKKNHQSLQNDEIHCVIKLTEHLQICWTGFRGF